MTPRNEDDHVFLTESSTSWSTIPTTSEPLSSGLSNHRSYQSVSDAQTSPSSSSPILDMMDDEESRRSTLREMRKVVRSRGLNVIELVTNTAFDTVTIRCLAYLIAVNTMYFLIILNHFGDTIISTTDKVGNRSIMIVMAFIIPALHYVIMNKMSFPSKLWLNNTLSREPVSDSSKLIKAVAVVEVIQIIIFFIAALVAMFRTFSFLDVVLSSVSLVFSYELELSIVESQVKYLDGESLLSLWKYSTIIDDEEDDNKINLSRISFVIGASMITIVVIYVSLLFVLILNI